MNSSDVTSYSSIGYFLKPGVARSAHSLCGTQQLAGASSPNSGLPLLLVASLDATDPRLGISNSTVNKLHLLYSWTCGISDGDFTYRESSEGVEILAYARGPAHDDFPYENYPAFFPRIAVELEALTAEEQDIIKQMNRRVDSEVPLHGEFPQLFAPRSQLGGEPRLMQWPPTPSTCPACGASMPLLASIGNENGSAIGFTDNQFVQTLFFLCDTCTVVTAYNMCD